MNWNAFAVVACSRPALTRLCLTACLLLMLVCASTLALSADNELFQVLGVKVDETDVTAAAAREKALQIGERQAWDILVQRFIDPRQRRLPQFSQQEISDAIRDFSVSAEKTSPVRYLATLNYSFNPPRVERLLASRNVRFTTNRSDPLVVVPVYSEDGVTRLWDDPNPWRQAWEANRLLSLVRLKVPSSDIANVSVITVDQALAGDRARLTELAQRNDAADALVAIAKLEPGATPNSKQLKVAAIRHNAALTQPLAERSFAIDEVGATPDLFAQAVLALASEVDAAYRRGWTPATGLQPAGEARSSYTRIIVPVSSLEDWVAMRKRLASLPQVERVKLISLTREQARLTIAFPGPTDQLAASITQSGLFMYKQNGEWVVSAEPERNTLQDGAIVP